MEIAKLKIKKAIIIFICLLSFGCSDDVLSFEPYRSMIEGTYEGYLWLNQSLYGEHTIEIIEIGDDYYELSISNIILKDTVIQISNLEFTLNDARVPGGAPNAYIELTYGQDFQINQKVSSSRITILSDQIHLKIHAESVDNNGLITSFSLNGFTKPY